MNKILIVALLFCVSLIQAQNPEIKTPATALEFAPRPDEKIKKEFPYDIPLSNQQGQLTNSAKVLSTEGKPTVVFFWMTTCGPCRAEMAAIKGKYEAWQKEAPFKMVAMSIDFPARHEAFKERVQAEGWQWEAYHDWNREFTAVMPGNLNGVPQVFLFDKEGKIVYTTRKYIGGEEDELFAKIKEMSGVK
jgi:cytochrome c biogenesis protein CcmG, thiol:disulfide interchange protein DsbE